MAERGIDRIRDRLGEEEFARRMAACKQREARERAQEARRAAEQERLRVNQLVIAQFNEDHPGGCERCGEDFDLENAEVVAADGTHLIIHASCMVEGDQLA